MARLWYILPTTMCLVALVGLQYGYFGLFRTVVTGSSIFAGYMIWTMGGRFVPVAFGIVAIIYNPVLPVNLERAVWFWMDTATAALFGAFAIYAELSERAIRVRCWIVGIRPMKLIPLSDRDLELIAAAIEARAAALQGAIIDEPSAAIVEGWREDVRVLLALRQQCGARH